MGQRRVASGRAREGDQIESGGKRETERRVTLPSRFRSWGSEKSEGSSVAAKPGIELAREDSGGAILDGEEWGEVDVEVEVPASPARPPRRVVSTQPARRGASDRLRPVR